MNKQVMSTPAEVYENFFVPTLSQQLGALIADIANLTSGD